MKEEKKKLQKNEDVEVKFDLPDLGKEYLYALGRRKSASAQVRAYSGGKGLFYVNGKEYKGFFGSENLHRVFMEPLELTGQKEHLNISVYVRGGGLTGQAYAIRHGVARALLLLDPHFRKVLKSAGFLTRDPRVKERKKPGLKKARRAPQWKKR